MAAAGVTDGALTVVGVLLEHRSVREAWAVGRLELTEATEGGSHRAGSRLTVVGPRLGLVAAGEALRLTGALEVNRFGEQLAIDSQESLGIGSPLQAHRWLERLDGVGPVLARRIHDQFGSGVLELLRAPVADALDPLCDVQGIDAVRAQTIRESWASVGASGSPEDLRYLDGLGLTRFETNQVLAFAKRRALAPRALLAEHPYDLVAVKGFGWLRTDVVARKAGAAADSPARLDTALSYLIGELCDADTLVFLGRLVAAGAKLTGCTEALVLGAIARSARADQLVITQDDQGRRNVHPPELVAAERAIWRVVRDQAPRAPAPTEPTEER